MSLNAISTATAGLAATQAAINIVSQNVANAGTAGYVKRTVSTVATGTNNSGVAVGTITRSFDAAALNQLRLETSGAAYTSTKAGIATQLDALYGTPGSSTSLDGTLNTFTQSLQELAANPTSAAARTTVLGNASALASLINSSAGTVQNLRTGIESQLGSDTSAASTLLANIATLNGKIQNNTDSTTLTALQDQRDQAINSLSSYMDVQTSDQRDGTVSVMTRSGVTLVDHGNAATLSFDGRGILDANSAYSTDPTQRTVGTITATLPGGGKIDLGAPGVLRSGSLAAGIELRDQTLPQAQRQLDDLAAGLASALSDKTVTGTSNGTQTSIDLTGIQPGNTLTFPVTVNGTVRNVILVASNDDATSVPASQTKDSTALVQTFKIPSSGSDYAGAINTALGNLGLSAKVAASGTGAALVIGPAAGSSDTVTSATANITPMSSVSDLTSGNPSLALFVDGTPNKLYTGSLDNGSQLTGFAQRITVNAALSGNTAALTQTSATDPSASGSRAQKLFSALTSTQQTFSSSSGIGGVSAPYNATVIGFAQDIVSTQGAASANASAIDDTQQTALSTAQSRFSAGAGVNIDQEMSNLIALQTAYGANARVLTAARDMLNQLLQI
ncbi:MULTISPECIES: flagellar hook-associated protein FlgK [Methylobacterium]|jgi:flagellar hook-associated protein 1 FlgK|uniref:Flagellar hook-associated protein 1 n=1 Tax=Methylobacterium fujisawaense TaxID=107400 RepID=A0ABR6D427_9HYPH|nr:MULTISPECIES: flagellar hook-associated protein FlgK [Methylobacterium]MBA9060743.1 flagellar hook-associated protein 1 FlgK [Methylobacterium fujisawaense]MBP29660.1 flagellar hook-associated protein FlgK [Methylobacterium sp.]MDH3029730.1 flagellar hook-associated protein FlgK [Methylobacterium fujisawaense]